MYTKPQRGRTAVLLLLSLIVLASPSFVHAAFTKQLAQGSQGVEVTELQQILTQQGFYTGPVTGYFGALTKAAVMAYQVAHGLSPVGQVGPQTRSSLNTGTSSTGTTVVSSVSTTQTITSQLTLGSTGPEVIALQHFLAVQGFYTYPTLTGFFGPVTKAAVMAYQIAHNISPVGEVGPQTRAAINAQIAVSSTQTSSTVSTTGTQTTSGGGGGGGGGGVAFAPSPAPGIVISVPTVTTSAATSVSATAAILNGSITADGGASSTVRGFNFGTTTSYGFTTVHNGTFDLGSFATTTATTATLVASTTYHYRAYATNSAGTAFGADQVFVTTSVPDVTPPVISAISAVAIATSSTDISWTTDELSSSQVSYGTTTAYGLTSSSGALVTSHTLTLSSLSPSTLYHYRVQSTDAATNTATSSDQSFTTTAVPTAPTVTTSAASSLATSSAVLNGNITNNNNASSTVRGFTYGLTTTYTATTTESGTFGVGAFATTTTGLTPSTLYHFRAYATNSAGTGIGSDQTFTTSALAAPVISAISSSTAATTAIITWTTDQNASSTVNYGTTSAYGTASTSAALVTSHTISLTGLTASTTYHFQVGGANSAGTISTSSDQVFITAAAADVTPPIISSIATSSVSTTTALISWTTNELSDSRIDFGTTTAYGSASTSATMVTSHSITLTGLTPNATYHFRIQSTDAASNVATSSDQNVTPLLVRDIASRGGAYIANNLAVTAPKTRQQYRIKYHIWRPAQRIALVFGNVKITGGTGQANGSNDISIRKVAVEKSSTTTPIYFGGSRTHTVSIGALNDVSDFASFPVSVGDDLWVRGENDLATGTNTYVFSPLYTNDGETSGVYDPTNELDSVDSTGTMTVPTGATANVNPYTPMMLIGETATGTWSVIGLGTSIEVGQVDETSAGASGGGYVRRAAYTKQRPFFNYALNGYKYNDVLTSHTLLDALLPYSDAAFVGGPTNDLQSGSTDTQTLTIMNSIYSVLRTGGIKWIGQGKILPRDTSTDKGVNPANQTPISQFTNGGYRDTTNTALLAKVGVNIDAFIDVSTPVEDSDHTKWKARSYSSTLAASALSTAASVSINAAPTQYEALVFDPSGASQAPLVAFIARTITGSGPFTVTTNSISTIGVAQSTSATVVGTSAYDTVHPQPLLNIDMAVPLTAALR